MSAESLGSRVKRIISGSASALVSAIEDLSPEMIMEQAIVEIDAAADEVRAELGRVVAGKHLASRRLAEENARHEKLGEQIAFAVDSSREDLAKSAISQQLDIEAQLPILEHTINDATTKERELEGYVLALAAKKREMQTELRSFREAKREVRTNPEFSGADGAATVGGKVARAESAFDRMLARQVGAPGMRGVADPKAAADLQELERLSRDNRIAERLAQLKAGRGSKGEG